MENRILFKARDLMLLNGVKHVTMDDIANQLGMSKKTIYQFYKDKDALVMAVVNFELEEQSSKCQRTQDTADNAVHEMFMLLEDIQQMFKNMNPMTMNEIAKYYPEAFARIQNHKDEFMHQIIKTNLIKGIEQGVYRK
jgi:AcrR family transcriptional regulator